MNDLNVVFEKNVIMNLSEQPRRDIKQINGELYIDYGSYNFYFLKYTDATIRESKTFRKQMAFERENKELKKTIEVLQSQLTGSSLKRVDHKCKMIIMKGGKND